MQITSYSVLPPHTNLIGHQSFHNGCETEQVPHGCPQLHGDVNPLTQHPGSLQDTGTGQNHGGHKHMHTATPGGKEKGTSLNETLNIFFHSLARTG